MKFPHILELNKTHKNTLIEIKLNQILFMIYVDNPVRS